MNSKGVIAMRLLLLLVFLVLILYPLILKKPSRVFAVTCRDVILCSSCTSDEVCSQGDFGKLQCCDKGEVIDTLCGKLTECGS